MAQNQYRFDYGDTVIVKQDAPAQFRPGELGEVCGKTSLGGRNEYTVEFSDGKSLEIEEMLIEKISG